MTSRVSNGHSPASDSIRRYTNTASKIQPWLHRVAASYNVLSMDAATFRVWVKLMRRRSDTVGEDAMMAAAAKVHNLTVVTQNFADFEPFGVRLLDPFGFTGGPG